MDNKKKGFYGSIVLMILICLVIICANFIVYFKYNSLLQAIHMRATSQGTISFTILPQEVVPGGGSSSSSSGGGGGGTSTKLAEFGLDQIMLKVGAKVGEGFSQSLTIKNPNAKEIMVKVSSSIEKLVVFSENEFVLPANGEKNISVSFISLPEFEPGVYTGEISISGEGLVKKLPFIYELRTKKSLMDVSLNVPAKYKELKSGDELLFQLTLFNLGETGRVDVQLEYVVQNFKGEVITRSSETVAVETQASFAKTLVLPDNLAEGDYVIYLSVRYNGSVASSSDVFSIAGEGPLITKISLLILGASIAAVMSLVVWYELRHLRLRKVISYQHKALSNIRERMRKGIAMSSVEKSDALRKLQSQESLLEQAHSAGYIREESYKTSKYELEKMIKKLR